MSRNCHDGSEPAPLAQFAAHGSDVGARLDAFVHRHADALSRHQSRALCAAGGVAIDGVRSEPAARLRDGDVVCWRTANLDLTLQLRLAVVHCAAGVLVVHKLPGVAVHRGPLVADTVAERIAAALPHAGLAQRLDRLASGLLLFGTEPAALAALSAAMQQDRIERHYLGIAAGHVAGDRRTIDLPLRVTDEPQGDRPKVVVDEHGQRAVTHLEVVTRSRDATLVRLRLETGRTHQIRAHLAAIGHPLLGDPRYGDRDANASAHRTHGIARVLLHCERLVFAAPGDGARVDVCATVEPDFARLFPQLRRRGASAS